MLEDDVTFREFGASPPETNILVVCIADNVAIQDDVRVIQGWLNFSSKLFEELNFWIN